MELDQKPVGIERARVKVVFDAGSGDRAETKREAAVKRMLARMRQGINFGDYKFDRSEIYEERINELEPQPKRQP